MGFFPPVFKTAVHELVETKQTTEKVDKETKDLAQQFPDLEKQATDAEARVADLRKQLAEYDHTDETDFAELQKKMNDSGASLQDQLIMAHAFIWTYSTSPHQVDALWNSTCNKFRRNRRIRCSPDKDKEAARQAASCGYCCWTPGAGQDSLTFAEWKDFLQDMSQEDLLKYMGHPQSQYSDYWVYSGEWVEDKITGKKVGLQISFNGTRVSNVSELMSHP